LWCASPPLSHPDEPHGNELLEGTPQVVIKNDRIMLSEEEDYQLQVAESTWEVVSNTRLSGHEELFFKNDNTLLNEGEDELRAESDPLNSMCAYPISPFSAETHQERPHNGYDVQETDFILNNAAVAENEPPRPEIETDHSLVEGDTPHCESPTSPPQAESQHPQNDMQASDTVENFSDPAVAEAYPGLVGGPESRDQISPPQGVQHQDDNHANEPALEMPEMENETPRNILFLLTETSPASEDQETGALLSQSLSPAPPYSADTETQEGQESHFEEGSGIRHSTSADIVHTLSSVGSQSHEQSGTPVPPPGAQEDTVPADASPPPPYSADFTNYPAPLEFRVGRSQRTLSIQEPPRYETCVPQGTHVLSACMVNKISVSSSGYFPHCSSLARTSFIHSSELCTCMYTNQCISSSISPHIALEQLTVSMQPLPPIVYSKRVGNSLIADGTFNTTIINTVDKCYCGCVLCHISQTTGAGRLKLRQRMPITYC
jgi:hypothetical protein